MPQLIGLARIGRDAEVRLTSRNDTVAQLSLAFTYGQKGEDGKRPTQWVDATLWGKRAEAMAPYLLKGQLVYVVLDDAHIEEFKTRDGRSGQKLAARVASIEFAGSSAGNAAKPAAPTPHPPTRPATPERGLADMDDDLPF